MFAGGPKHVQQVCIDQDERNGDILGLKMLDSKGVPLIDRQWRAKLSQARWLSFQVPPGYHIIGLHGSDDGAAIKSLGFAIAGHPTLAMTRNTRLPPIKSQP